MQDNLKMKESGGRNIKIKTNRIILFVSIKYEKRNKLKTNNLIIIHYLLSQHISYVLVCHSIKYKILIQKVLTKHEY